MKNTIIITDDQELNRTILRSQLENTYDILEAIDGEKLISLLETEYYHISAIILDVVMPVMNGFEALTKIRNNNLFKNIPVLLITADNSIDLQKKAIEYGANGYLQKPFDNYLVEKALENVIQFHKNAVLVDTLSKDKLTGMMNHELFFDECNKLLTEHENGYYIMSSLDIENFKVINDQYGVDAADEILKHVANCISICYKDLGGLSCRFSADRFATLYPAEYANTSVILENHKLLTNPKCINHPIRVRIGRFHAVDSSIKAQVMFERATIAQEAIKGRYDVYIQAYDDSIRSKILKEQQIINEMGKALENGQFIPFLQPQYNYTTNTLIGAEALVRWQKEDTIISPSEFIPIFEKNGFIYEVDKYIWEQACWILRKWIDEGKKPLPISVNISRCDLYREDFFDVICSLVRKYKLPTNLLRLEVTESAFSDSPEHIITMVNQLISYGFTIEIDDFGSGYSSLNALKDVPASILKLDMKFFSDTANAVRSGNIIESVVRMAKWLGMSVIAEGVEKSEQADYLVSIGCYYIQGYLYSKPIPVADYEKLLVEKEHEHNLIQLKTVTNLDNNQFWNPESMETLIFNSYVGGACILEQYQKKLELLRINSQYVKILQNVLQSELNLTNLNPANFLDEKNLRQLNQTVENAVTTKSEASCELKIPNDHYGFEYIRFTLRLIAMTQERNLFYCVIINMTEQRTTEQKLIVAKQKELENAQSLKIIMDNVNGGVSAIKVYDDGTSQFLFNNEKYYELYGYSAKLAKEEYLDILKTIHPDDLPNVLSKINKLKKDRIPTMIDYRITKRDGSHALLRAMSSVMNTQDYGDDVITSVITDITEKRLLEDQLRAIISSINAGVTATIINDGEPEFILENDQFYHMLGYESKEQFEVECKNKFSAIHPDDRDKIIERYMNMDGGKENYSLHYRIIRRDGEIRYIWNNTSVIHLFAFQKPVQLSVATDVTEDYLLREKEHQSAEKLRTILGCVENGITAIVLHSDHMEFALANQAFYRMHGLSEKENKLVTIADAIKLIHPDDRYMTKQIIEESIKTGESRQIEYRLIRPDKTMIWISTTISIAHITGVKAPVQIAVYVDISDRKEKESQGQNLLDHLPVGAALYEYDGTSLLVLHINKSYWKMVQRHQDNCKNISIIDAIHPDDQTFAMEKIQEGIRKKKTVSATIRIRTGRSGYKLFRVTINCMKKDTKYLIFAAYEFAE